MNDKTPRGLMAALEDDGWYWPVEHWPVTWWRKLCGWVGYGLSAVTEWFVRQSSTPARNDNPQEEPRTGVRNYESHMSLTMRPHDKPRTTKKENG
jgi:hypothetical protein